LQIINRTRKVRGKIFFADYEKVATKRRLAKTPVPLRLCIYFQ